MRFNNQTERYPQSPINLWLWIEGIFIYGLFLDIETKRLNAAGPHYRIFYESRTGSE